MLGVDDEPEEEDWGTHVIYQEWWTTASDVPFSHKLIEGKTVLYSGLTMEERGCA